MRKEILKEQKVFMILLAHRLEKLILLKCLYYTKYLQIECNPFQISSGIFHINRTNDPYIFMEQMNPDCHKNIEKEEQTWI